MIRTGRVPSRSNAWVLTLTVVVVAAVSGATADAAVFSPRVVVKRYVGPAQAASVSTPVPTTTLVGYCDPAANPSPITQGCVRFKVRARDRYVSFEIHDATRLSVLGFVIDVGGAVHGFFCEKMTEALPVPATPYLDVWLVPGNCPGTYLPSVPTTGEVKASFSRVPPA